MSHHGSQPFESAYRNLIAKAEGLGATGAYPRGKIEPAIAERVDQATAELRQQLHAARNAEQAALSKLALAEIREKILRDALWDIGNSKAFFEGERTLTMIARAALNEVMEP
ncbi:MAG: hypothetical protein JWN86_705 [Planctomycetota bacterium]|nr:hypothetical protein [Planctomycetota bacterium]